MTIINRNQYCVEHKHKPKVSYGIYFCCEDCGMLFVVGYSNPRYCKKCRREIEDIFPEKPYKWEG